MIAIFLYVLCLIDVALITPEDPIPFGWLDELILLIGGKIALVKAITGIERSAKQS